MVEQVNISGVSFSNSLPKWATEQTMQELQDEIVKIVKILEKKSDYKKDPVTQKKMKADKEQLKIVQDLNEEQKKHESVLKKMVKGFSESTENTSDAIEKLRTNITGGYLGISMLTNASQGLTTIMGGLLSPMSILGTGVTLAGAAIQSFIGYIVETSNVLIGLYENGITFQKGLSDLRLGAANAALPLDEFADLLVKNSKVIKAFGKSGSYTIGELSRETRRLVTSFALSTEDVNEYLGSYLDTLRIQGMLNKSSAKEQEEGAANYIENLTRFSQIIGISRKQLEKTIQAQRESPNVFAVLDTLPDQLKKKAYESFNASVGTIAGALGDNAQPILDALSRSTTSIDFTKDNFFKALQTMAPDAANSLASLGQSIKAGTITQEDAIKQTSYILQSIQQSDKDRLATFIQVENPLKESAESLSNIKRSIAGVDLSYAKLSETVKPDPFIIAMKKLELTFQMLKGKFSAIIGKFLEANEKTINRIATNLAEFADELAPELEKVLMAIGRLFDPKTRAAAWNEIKDSLMAGLQYVMDGIADFVDDYVQVKLGIKSKEEVEAQNKAKQNLDKEFTKVPETERTKKIKDIMKNTINTNDLVDDSGDLIGGNQNKLEDFYRRAKQLNLDADKILKPVMEQSNKMGGNFADAVKEVKDRLKENPDAPIRLIQNDKGDKYYGKAEWMKREYADIPYTPNVPVPATPSVLPEPNTTAGLATNRAIREGIKQGIEEVNKEQTPGVLMDPQAQMQMQVTNDLLRKQLEKTEEMKQHMETVADSTDKSANMLGKVNSNIKRQDNVVN